MQLPPHGLSFFAQAAYAQPLNSYDDYKPDERVTVDLGTRHQATEKVVLLLQLNTLWIGRDSGDEAEPDDSGGTYVFVSSGVSVSLGRSVQVFALVQLAVYQYVNGLQLTADRGATGGIGSRFR